MHKKDRAMEALLGQKILPLYYHADAFVCSRILESLYAAGIRSVEFTNRGPEALENFKVLRHLATEKMPGMQLGIGTIKTAQQAKDFIDAGADFIVCPTVNAGVAAAVADAGLLWIPGCMTPTEIAEAETLGASLVKIFPGNILGPSYISAIKDLFPSLRFMPTGGVEASTENLKGWFGAGVVAVGMGSKLITKELLDAEDYDGLEKATRSALQLVQQAATN